VQGEASGAEGIINKINNLKTKEKPKIHAYLGA
jgi:hypothetical protein